MMRNPGAPRPLEHRYSNHPMLAHEEPDELDQIEVRKEEKPMGICKVEGCGRTAIAKGLCRLHYDRARAAAQPKRSRPAPAATPQVEPTPAIIPHKGKLYLLAEIRVMTEEKLREMFGG